MVWCCGQAVENGVMCLSLASGYEQPAVELSSHLIGMRQQHILEVRLVLDKSTSRYTVVGMWWLRMVCSPKQQHCGPSSGRDHNIDSWEASGH